MKKGLENLIKGLENLIKFCKKFNHIALEKHLKRQEQLHETYRKIKLHKHCQCYAYNQNKKRPATIALLPEEKATGKILRSSMETFDWISKCMFCGGPCQKYIRYPNRNNCHEVATLHFINVILQDIWQRGSTLPYVLQNNIYESRKNILSWKKNANEFTGRPAENEKLLHFDQLCEWIEQEAECYTVK